MLSHIREQYIHIIMHVQVEESTSLDEDMFSINPLQHVQLSSVYRASNSKECALPLWKWKEI